jgi:hypothetical protein
MTRKIGKLAEIVWNLPKFGITEGDRWFVRLDRVMPDQCGQGKSNPRRRGGLRGGLLHGSFRAFAGSKGASTLLWWRANEMRMGGTQAAHSFTIHSPHDRSVMPPYTDVDGANSRHGRFAGDLRILSRIGKFSAGLKWADKFRAAAA